MTQEYKDIVEHYYKNITPDTKYYYNEYYDSYFYFDEESKIFFQHSSSDIVLAMKPYYDNRKK